MLAGANFEWNKQGIYFEIGYLMCLQFIIKIAPLFLT